jgi:hypothetical protein
MDMEDVNDEIEEVSTEAVCKLSSDRSLERIRDAVSPYPERMSFLDAWSKFQMSHVSISASMNFLRASPTLMSAPRAMLPSSRFESLPNEILLNIVRFLDIASLAKFAGSNSSMRRLVLSVPNVRTVKSHPTTSLAVARMLHAGAARHFSLQKLLDTITKTTCSICKDPAAFAPWLCLLLCKRFCPNCISHDLQTIRMPVTMAFTCLNLIAEDIREVLGTATADMQPNFVRARNPRQNGLQSSRIIRQENKIEIISMRAALNVSIMKHAAEGGSSYVKRLLESYVRENHPELVVSGRFTTITNDCNVRGLSDAIRKEWGNKYPSQDWVLMAYMPHLRSLTPPLRFETGIVCEGCARDARHGQTLALRYAARKASQKAYLTSQYLAHFAKCDAAQLIARGQRLNMADENKLRKSMHDAIARFQLGTELTNISRRVSFDTTPSEVREAVESALQQIYKAGNRHIQQRTSCKWQTVVARPNPAGK